jgi:MFS family permease
MTPSPASRDEALFGWWYSADLRARRAFIAAWFGWMLDSFDVMLYSMVVAALVADQTLRISLTTAGALNSLTLLSAAFGGVAFGVFADRVGRARALIAAVLTYSIFTAASGLAQSALQLGIFRVLLGIGMGGEWAVGAALVSETFAPRHRGKALAYVQSAWAIGYGLAALVNLVVMPVWGWRGVFFIGVAPALFTLWIRRHVEDSTAWQTTGHAERGRIGALFTAGMARTTIAVTFMNGTCLFAWWGLNGWVPAYLRLSPEVGGIGLSTVAMSWFVLAMQVGMWFGYVLFGYIADAIGRRTTYLGFLLTAAVLLPIYGFVREPIALFLLGPIVAFVGTGYLSGIGAVVADLYPPAVRATAAAVCYNLGRVASAAAPFTVGSLAETRGFGIAFTTVGVAFVVAAASWIWIPDTAPAD